MSTRANSATNNNTNTLMRFVFDASVLHKNAWHQQPKAESPFFDLYNLSNTITKHLRDHLPQTKDELANDLNQTDVNELTSRNNSYKFDGLVNSEGKLKLEDYKTYFQQQGISEKADQNFILYLILQTSQGTPKRGCAIFHSLYNQFSQLINSALDLPCSIKVDNETQIFNVTKNNDGSIELSASCNLAYQSQTGSKHSIGSTEICITITKNKELILSKAELMVDTATCLSSLSRALQNNNEKSFKSLLKQDKKTVSQLNTSMAETKLAGITATHKKADQTTFYIAANKAISSTALGIDNTTNEGITQRPQIIQFKNEICAVPTRFTPKRNLQANPDWKIKWARENLDCKVNSASMWQKFTSFVSRILSSFGASIIKPIAPKSCKPKLTALQYSQNCSISFFRKAPSRPRSADFATMEINNNHQKLSVHSTSAPANLTQKPTDNSNHNEDSAGGYIIIDSPRSP